MAANTQTEQAPREDVGLVQHMRTAVLGAVAPGPEFLGGRIDADAMATHMVASVEGFQSGHQDEIRRLADGHIAATPEGKELTNTLFNVTDFARIDASAYDIVREVSKTFQR